MGLLKAMELIDVAVAQVAAAAATYQRNFGLRATGVVSEGAPVLLPIGESAIRLTPAGAGQGLVGLWLEADDITRVEVALAQAGFGCRPIRRQEAMRILEVERSCGQGPLFIFDRRP